MIGKIAHALRNRKGFTLVELMVVVVIIAVLTAIAVPVYTSSTKKAERSAVEANLRTIDGAISQYQAVNNGADPDNLGALVGTYLQSEPNGPGTASYKLGGDPLRAQVTSTEDVGGKTLTAASLPITWE
ncbi:MAG: prepilin-type N-terminal cleavage/methylation domain-containing protein [Desulfotomaculaceae bacterium]|nr:prepilin-type N-terminal cleavage/methylation domain-containing protein [Desulfotomaculaceae bacterium]